MRKVYCVRRIRQICTESGRRNSPPHCDSEEADSCLKSNAVKEKRRGKTLIQKFRAA